MTSSSSLTSYPTWEAFKASPYHSMTEKQFRMLLGADRDGTIRYLATAIAGDMDRDGLIALLVGLHLGNDFSLDESDDEDIVETAKDQCLIRHAGVCKFCDEPVGMDYHLHQGSFVGEDCCWDVRLKSTE